MKRKRTNLIVSVLVLAGLAAFSLSGYAGDLEPSGLPGPTMHSLDEIFDKIGSALPPGWKPMPSHGQAEGKSAIHMSLEGENQGNIEGSCEAEGREDTIVVVGLEHQVSIPLDPQSGLPTVKRVHEPLSILKYIDKASPKLYAALCTGEHLSEVVLKFYRIDRFGGEEHYYTITLEDAIIVERKRAFPNVESVSFVYSRIRWTWEIDGIEWEDDWLTPR